MPTINTRRSEFGWRCRSHRLPMALNRPVLARAPSTGSCGLRAEAGASAQVPESHAGPQKTTRAVPPQGGMCRPFAGTPPWRVVLALPKPDTQKSPSMPPPFPGPLAPAPSLSLRGPTLAATCPERMLGLLSLSGGGHPGPDQAFPSPLPLCSSITKQLDMSVPSPVLILLPGGLSFRFARQRAPTPRPGPLCSKVLRGSPGSLSSRSPELAGSASGLCDSPGTHRVLLQKHPCTCHPAKRRAPQKWDRVF